MSLQENQSEEKEKSWQGHDPFADSSVPNPEDNVYGRQEGSTNDITDNASDDITYGTDDGDDTAEDRDNAESGALSDDFDIDSLFDDETDYSEKWYAGDKYFEFAIPKEKFSYSLICFIIVAAVTIVSAIGANLNSASITVVMNFPEIADGCNPDGTPFDIYDFLSDEVLERACEKLDNRVSVDLLKRHLWIDGTSSQASFNTVRQNILDGEENSSYFPSSYNITYTVVSDMVKALGGTTLVKAVFEQIGLPSKATILRAVAEAYSEYYNDAYVNTGEALMIDWGNINDLDHFNRVTRLRGITDRMRRYLNERYQSDTLYVSSDGAGFGDLATALNTVANVDIENYESFIIQNGLTTNRERLLKQLRSVSISSKELYDRSTAEHNVMLEGIEMYDPNITKVVFIPSLDESDEFYMNRTQIGIDYLTDRAESAQHTADEANSLSKEYDGYITRFSNEAGSSKELLAQADELFNNIVDKLDAFSERAITVNNEYIESKAYEGVEVRDISRGVGIVSTAASALKTAVLWSAFFYMLYYICSMSKKLYKKYSETKKEGDELDDRA